MTSAQSATYILVYRGRKYRHRLFGVVESVEARSSPTSVGPMIVILTSTILSAFVLSAFYSPPFTLRPILPCVTALAQVTMASVQTTRLNHNNNNPFISELGLLPKSLFLRVFTILPRSPQRQYRVTLLSILFDFACTSTAKSSATQPVRGASHTLRD